MVKQSKESVENKKNIPHAESEGETDLSEFVSDEEEDGL